SEITAILSIVTLWPPVVSSFAYLFHYITTQAGIFYGSLPRNPAPLYERLLLTGMIGLPYSATSRKAGQATFFWHISR
ncbi:hypothetical protein ABTK38_21390, partial [Acinetobacter baumannii]